MQENKDLTGNKFFRLLVLSRADKSKWGDLMWNVVCDCGTEKKVAQKHLLSGNIKSCGCYMRTIRTGLFKDKNLGARAQYRAYSCWNEMKRRCYDPNRKGYKHWGGRGIVICDRWLNSFESFLADMGECEKGYSIERKDVNGNYEPSNCIWMLRNKQNGNKTNSVWLEYDGRKMILSDWAREFGINSVRITRWRKGNDFEAMAAGFYLAKQLTTIQNKYAVA